jgi:hypothetical protein
MGVADRLAPKVQGSMIAPKEVRVPEPVEYPDIKETVVPMHKHNLVEYAENFHKNDHWNVSGSLKKKEDHFKEHAERYHGKKAAFVSHEGHHGVVPHSELGMHTKTAGKKIKRYALFTHPEHGHVTSAHIETHDGHVTHGLPSEVLPHEIREKHSMHKSEPKGDIEKTQKNPSTTVPYEEKPTHREYMKDPDNTSEHMQALRDKNMAVSPEVPAALHASGAIKKAQMHAVRPEPTPIKPPAKNIPDEPKKPPMGKNWAYNWSR